MSDNAVASALTWMAGFGICLVIEIWANQKGETRRLDTLVGFKSFEYGTLRSTSDVGPWM